MYICCYILYVGTKNVAKKIVKIAQGPACSEGVTWFCQLSDKHLLLVLIHCHYLKIFLHQDTSLLVYANLQWVT